MIRKSLGYLLIAILICSLFIPTATAVGKTDWEQYKRSGHTSPKWDSLVDAGFSAFESGNLGTAEVFLQRAIAKGCDDGLIYVKIAIYYEAQNNYKKALSFFQKAGKKLPSQYPSHSLTKKINESIGRIYFMMGKKAEAIPYLEKALDEGENFMALYLMGQILAAKGDSKNAMSYLERAINAPHGEGVSAQVDLLIMTELGKITYQLKDFDRSLAWWDKILQIDPQNPTALSYKEDIERQRYKEQEMKVLEEMM